MAGRVSGVAVFYATAGGVLLWSGIKGQTIAQTVRAITSGSPRALSAQGPEIAGTPVLTSAPASPAGAPAPPGAPVGGLFGAIAASAAGAAIAADAQRYAGAGYVWGGAPAQGTGNWDCSSFVNWVTGHDAGLAIPGYPAGTYTGAAHGPPTMLWLLWPGAVTVPQAQAAPGDLIVWPTHMGIYLGGGQMISALDPADGTKVTTIADGSPGGEGSGTYRRLRAA